MAEYVSSHSQLPGALTLEFERVLSPCLLDGHNRYAGAEYVSGTEARPSLLAAKAVLDSQQSGLLGLCRRAHQARDGPPAASIRPRRRTGSCFRRIGPKAAHAAS